MAEFVINKSFNSKVERTPRVLEVAEAFGLGLEEKEFVVYSDFKVDIKQGDVVYITGQSGSGKSLILRELSLQMRDKPHNLSVCDIDNVKMKDEPIIEQLGKDLNDAVRLLSLAGLNDAYLFVRKPSELSDGQRYRFKLAKVIESGASVWVADEFTGILDRVTARVVSHNLQRVARKVGATVIVATTHMDLNLDLKPTVRVEKYYKDRVKVEISDET